MIADADGSTAGTARTVALAVGTNVVAATVTAADGVTTRAYTVTVERQGPPSRDIDTLAAAGNQHARGLWSDGEVLWVADYADSKLYAYELADGARLASRDIATWDGVTRNAARYPTDAWSDGETVWVSDNERDRVYAYRLSDGRRQSGRDPALAVENRHPNGVWGDGETLWALDDRDAWAYAYRLSGRHAGHGARVCRSGRGEPGPLVGRHDLLVGGLGRAQGAGVPRRRARGGAGHRPDAHGAPVGSVVGRSDGVGVGLLRRPAARVPAAGGVVARGAGAAAAGGSGP